MCPELNLEDDDENGGITPSTATEDPKPKGSQATAALPDDDDVDFGDEDAYRRPGELEMLTVKSVEKNHFVRFSILPNPATGRAFMKRSYIHYVMGKGYARCHTKRDKKQQTIGEPAFCCKLKEGEPRYNVIVVQYTTIDPKTGKFRRDVPVEFAIKCVSLSRIGYKEISMLPGLDDNENSIPVTSIDITGTPNDKSKGFVFARISQKASWTKFPELKAAVEEALKPFHDGRELHRKGGKELNVPEMKAFLGIGAGASDDGPGMDDLD